MKILLIKLASWYLKKQGIVYMTKDAFKVPVIIKYNGKEIKVKGFVDTGNELTEPFSMYPVIIVEIDVLKNEIPDIYNYLDRIIPYGTIDGGNGTLLGFQPEEIKIKNKIVKDVIVGITKNRLSNNGIYNAILNPDLLFV